MIVPDALRAKQLPVYGYTGIDTPNIDALAKESTIFHHCYVRRAETFSSVSSFFSGQRFPSGGLKRGEKTMAEFFKENGYDTVSFVSSYVLWSGKEPVPGQLDNQFYRGFDEYIQDTSIAQKPYYRENEATTNDVLNWLDKRGNRDTPFFLFAHYMDPHAPYIPSYDKEIEKIDVELGRIIRKLKALELYNNSIIIFTSDHGESLGHPVDDHGAPRGHGWLVYAEHHHIPMLIKFPWGRFKKNIRQVVRSIDLLPTLLDYTGAHFKRNQLDGLSLLTAIRDNRNLQLSAFCNNTGNRLNPEGLVSIIFHHNEELFQYIRGSYTRQNVELYNLSQDPGEQRNLAADNKFKPVMARAVYLMNPHEKKLRLVRVKGNKRSFGSKEQKALSSLGYLAGGAPSPTLKVRQTTMQEQLKFLGLFNYRKTIRRPRWSHKPRDPFFPQKMAGSGDRLYILANRQRILLEYTPSSGFRPTGIEGVRDIAFDSAHNRLFFLKDSLLYVLPAGASRAAPAEISWKNEPLPAPHAVYVGMGGNIFLFSNQYTTRFDSSMNIKVSFKLKVKSSVLFSEGPDGSLYHCMENKILKYSPTGVLLSPFTIYGKKIRSSSIQVDQKNRLWVFCKQLCRINVFTDSGKIINSFDYRKAVLPGWKPVPTRQALVSDNRLFFMDNWERVLVYTIDQAVR